MPEHLAGHALSLGSTDDKTWDIMFVVCTMADGKVVA